MEGEALTAWGSGGRVKGGVSKRKGVKTWEKEVKDGDAGWVGETNEGDEGWER